MQYGLFFAISATACLIGGNFAFAEEVGNSTTNTQTNITSGTASNSDDATTNDATPTPRGGGNVEWRRSDHGAPNPSRSAGESSRGTSDSSGGGGSDGGGGGSSSD